MLALIEDVAIVILGHKNMTGIFQRSLSQVENHERNSPATYPLADGKNVATT